MKTYIGDKPKDGDSFWAIVFHKYHDFSVWNIELLNQTFHPSAWDAAIANRTYFKTKRKAVKMLHKLRKVLRGKE